MTKLANQLMSAYKTQTKIRINDMDQRESTTTETLRNDIPQKRTTSILNQLTVKDQIFSNEEAVKNILKNKQKLRAFREMVVMHVKKNDL